MAFQVLEVHTLSKRWRQYHKASKVYFCVIKLPLEQNKSFISEEKGNKLPKKFKFNNLGIQTISFLNCKNGH